MSARPDGGRAQPVRAGTAPSLETRSYWLSALNQSLSGRPENREYSGKWLIFVAKNLADQEWGRIRTETAAGRLGCRSKVSTEATNPAQRVRNPSDRVIVVFTYDYRDLADVRRVRARLRELGFAEKLAYKTNEATRARLYGEPDDLSVHMLYE